MSQGFEHEAAGSCAYDEAVAALVERTGGGRRRIVEAGREAARRGEPSEGDAGDAGLGAAADDDVGLAGAGWRMASPMA